MDFKLVASSCIALFLAEMGDRTQFVALSLAVSSKKPWSVFCGALAGLALALLATILLSDILGRFFPEIVLRKTGAVLCVLIGVWMWFR